MLQPAADRCNPAATSGIVLLVSLITESLRLTLDFFQRKRWIKKGKPMPPWVFAPLEGTALEERNVRHVFTRMLQKAGSGRFAFTISGTRSRRCCSSRASRSPT